MSEEKHRDDRRRTLWSTVVLTVSLASAAFFLALVRIPPEPSSPEPTDPLASTAATDARKRIQGQAPGVAPKPAPSETGGRPAPDAGTTPIARSTDPTPEAPLPCTLRVEQNGRVVLDACDGAEPLPRGEEGARRFLESHAAALGLDGGATDLQTLEVKHGLASSRTHFDQTLHGLRVHEAHVTVTQNAEGRVTGVYSTYASSDRETPTPRPALAGPRAEQLAREAARATTLRLPSKMELVWVTPSRDELRLAWRVMVYAEEPLGDFLTIVDDATGRVLSQENRIALATGSGLIFQPNPIQTTGDTSLTDGADATNAILDAERVSVPLLGLDDTVGTLKGEFVDLVSLAGGEAVPDANEPSRIYEYDRSDKRFEQVNIYASIDSIQRYFHALGFDDHTGVPNGIRDFPTLAHAHWNADDQSFYSSGDDAVHFGDGGVDDGEDADIIAHEYGHAVQHNQNACWGGGEMGAMGEGFGDYLAVSFYFDAGDAPFQASHASCVGEWDASSYSGQTPPCLRRIDGTKIYPGDLVGQVHADGEIWSRALWDLRALVGATISDTLVLEHHFNVPCNATMTDAANTLLQADQNVYGGVHTTAIQTAFCDRGILSGAACVPPPSLSLSQTLLPATPAAGTIATVTITARNVSLDPVEALVLRADIPTGSSYVIGSASDQGTEAAGVISWTIGGLNPGEEAIRSYQIQVDLGPGTVTTLADSMENGGALWVASHASGAVDWTLDTAQSHSPATAWFASEPASLTDQRLTTAAPSPIASESILSFWHSYDTEANFDGGVVEVSTDAGTTWSDLGAAMTQNGYSGTISLSHQSPIAQRNAFTGNSGGFVKTVVDLSSVAGSDALFRFRMASDVSIGGNGWRVDDVELIRPVSLSIVASVSGGETTSSTLEATVNPPPPNTAPTIETNLGLTLDRGTSSAIDGTRLKTTDPDAGDVLTYSTLTPPLHGTLTPATGFSQADIDAGALSYQHDGGTSTTDAFTFSVSDGRGGESASATFSITITPTNQPPSLGLSTLPSATAGVLYTLTLTPSDPDAGDTLSLFLDAGPAWLGTPVAQPNGQWLLTGTPLDADIGTTAVQLRVRDSGSPPLEDSLSLSLIVAAAPAPVPGLSLLGAGLACGFGIGVARARIRAGQDPGRRR